MSFILSKGVDNVLTAIKYVAQFKDLKFFVCSYSNSSATENIENATLYSSEQDLCNDVWLQQYVVENSNSKFKIIKLRVTLEVIDI